MNKIASLKPGDDGVLIEALINHVVSGKTNGAHRSTYLSMTLQDDTGSIDAKLWNASEEQVQTLVKGSVVQIKGDVIKYNEDRQMKIVKIYLASQDDKERIKFLKQAPLDSQFMINEIKKFIDQIDNLKLHQLVKTLFEENIEKTKKVVELAAKYGATVEAELGLVGGSEDGKSDHGIRCTNPEDAKIFCEETGIDALAVAIGNAHGDYPVAPQLEFGVLEEIHNRTGIPLVLHGGSGITDADFQKAISLGIRKVNIATASFKSLTKEVENYLATEGAHNYFDMNEAMVLGTYKNVKHHIEVFNCK